VEEAADGTLVYRAGAGESNNLSVSNQTAGAVSIRDLTGLTERTPLCDEGSSIRVNCVPGSRLSEVRPGDRNDNFAIDVRGAVVVDAGPGDDGYTASNPTLPSRVDYRGGDGFDSTSYGNANRGVRLTNDGAANDGRIALDQDNIGRDVERLTGSAFGDEITALGDATVSSPLQSITSGQGNDTLRDGPGSVVTFFVVGPVADGADDIIGGSGISSVRYDSRTRPVNVTLNFGGADDGEQVEGDEIIGGNEQVIGGPAGDTLRTPAGSNASHNILGQGGDDQIDGSDGADTLGGGVGSDTIRAFGGDHRIFAKDGEVDTVECGSDFDTVVDRDANDDLGDCDGLTVGVLRLAPKALRATAGETARLKLSRRHPRS
jgi:Ca2+-binding RTX toxin-like protein